MTKPRIWHTYQFKVGHKVVHGGITQDPERREIEHQNNLNQNGHLKLVGHAKTEEGARKWERDNGYC
ncbi:hypothetical protein ACFLV2_02220 [Chloroflexota bacterium]